MVTQPPLNIARVETWCGGCDLPSHWLIRPFARSRLENRWQHHLRGLRIQEQTEFPNDRPRYRRRGVQLKSDPPIPKIHTARLKIGEARYLSQQCDDLLTTLSQDAIRETAILFMMRD